ncbi:hypothetical protein QBC38DRAFT_469940 [Podospora fimiseda]|uniref:Uncharacterized protein n=1 Tax=Podospora fimiseda TaxID=252190 RepID=A0AAN7BVU0_9PEZI|nr:hypothetical protein QBC38DRAFT_469940 [Podospora fimiseda]
MQQSRQPHLNYPINYTSNISTIPKMTRYNLIVENHSGANQSYALVSAAPDVSNGGVKPKIWSTVSATAAAPQESTISFAIQNQFFGFVGSSQGKPEDAVTVGISVRRPVVLGQRAADGTAIPGTTLAVTIASDINAPTFDDHDRPNSADANSFAITTPIFDNQVAINNNWLIGVGGAGNGSNTPIAAFIPQPQVTYQIRPSNTYYLIPGRYDKNSIVDFNKVGNRVEIDFARFPSGEVTVVHDQSGRLTIQRD